MKWTQATNKRIIKNIRKIRIAGYYLHKYCKDFKDKASFFYCSAYCQSKAVRRLVRQVRQGVFDPNSYDGASLDFFNEIAGRFCKDVKYGQHYYKF